MYRFTDIINFVLLTLDLVTEVLWRCADVTSANIKRYDNTCLKILELESVLMYSTYEDLKSFDGFPSSFSLKTNINKNQ